MTLEARIFQTLHALKGDVPEDEVPTFPLSDRVPRIVHQTFSTSTLPDRLRDNVARLRSQNPDWDYRFYDDAERNSFVQRYYGSEVLWLYRRINPAYGPARADLFRYLMMYRIGGVYLDIKSSPLRPLNDVINVDDKFLLSQWKNKAGQEYAGWGLHPELSAVDGGEFQQWHIVAAAGHPFLRAVISKVLNNIVRYNRLVSGVGQIGVVRLSGPIAYTLAIVPLLPFHQHRFVDYESDLGFEYSVLKDQGQLAHKAMVKKHYSQLTEPVVTPTAADRAVHFAVRSVRAVRRLAAPFLGSSGNGL